MPNAQEVLEWMAWDKERKANMTNEEYIRTCSTEELAKLLYRIGFLSYITGNVLHNAIMQGIQTEEAFELWLKEKHE